MSHVWITTTPGDLASNLRAIQIKANAGFPNIDWTQEVVDNAKEILNDGWEPLGVPQSQLLGDMDPQTRENIARDESDDDITRDWYRRKQKAWEEGYDVSLNDGQYTRTMTNSITTYGMGPNRGVMYEDARLPLGVPYLGTASSVYDYISYFLARWSVLFPAFWRYWYDTMRPRIIEIVRRVLAR